MTNYLSVLVPVPGLQDATYTYAADEAVEIGERVEVVFGRRPVIGYVVGSAPPYEKASPILRRCEGFSLFSPEMIELTRWMAAAFFSPWYLAMEAAVPSGLKMRKGATPKTRRVLAPGRLALDHDRAGARDERLCSAVRFVADHPETVSVAELARRLEMDRGPLDRLVKKGIFFVHEVEERRDPFLIPFPAEPPPPAALTAEQAAAASVIERAAPGGEILLFGVTGSGKTEIYLRAIARLLAEKRGAIVLVPEISLTPQSVARFRARFGKTVAVLHSGLSGGERLDEWLRIRRGEARVVIGARSAVFAPVANLGVIVIDEAHEGSYKQNETPRYHAVEVARERAARGGAILILGTATPTVELYHAALNERNRMGRPVTLVRLTRRIENRPHPEVTVVDMREELAAGHRSIFSRLMARAIDGVLKRREQAILFLNRRGHSAFILCRACGETIRCPRCAVSLTGHRDARAGHGRRPWKGQCRAGAMEGAIRPDRLVCHFCNHRIPSPAACPSCGSGMIKPFGAGTERVEAEVRKLWPAARVLRMDADTTVKKGAHRTMLDAFAAGDYDILVGTQMIGKGLDLPRVTLVGVVAAESSLHLPDFRATERTFTLLVQVAGRAGRAELKGRAILQTYAPHHPAVARAASQDVETFLREELANRKASGLPPFSRIIQWTLETEEEDRARTIAERIAVQLSGFPGTLLGPAPAPIERLRGRYRWQVRWLVPVEMEEEKIRDQARRVETGATKGERVLLDYEPLDLL